MAWTAEQPTNVDPDLLSAFVEQLARLATNLGRADEAAEDVLRALDVAIELQAKAGRPLTALYRAKASYLRSEATESKETIAALRAAISSAAPGDDAWAGAVIDLCSYHVEVSEYRQALRTIRDLRRHMPVERLQRKFECAALAYEGVVLLTSFRNLRRAETRLGAACEFEERGRADQDIGLWVSTAFHYLGRLAEVRRQYQTSLQLYVTGHEIAQQSRELIMSDAFVHLRMAETLVAAGLLSLARDHLDEAARLVRVCSNRSGARLQVDLGYATHAAALDDVAHAEGIVEDAMRRARAQGFWRGELLCQGYLLALLIRRRRFGRLPGLGIRILGGLRLGELRRNGILRLVTRIPVILPVALRRMSSGRATKGGNPERVSHCPCSMHASASASPYAVASLSATPVPRV
jgi:tetratricopeptide (TPR) repeat protein